MYESFTCVLNVAFTPKYCEEYNCKPSICKRFEDTLGRYCHSEDELRTLDISYSLSTEM
jgi:hypothetical protein